MTLEEAKGKQAAAAQNLTMNNPSIEVFPGVTLQQIRAKQAAASRETVDPRKIFPPNAASQR
jgi:hypothetical protein